MSVFRNHYSDLSYHNVIGFTINRIFRLPNPVEFSWNGKWKGGGIKCRAFASKKCYIYLQFFLKGGGDKILVHQVAKQRKDCCIYRIFSSDIKHTRMSLSSAFMSILWHHKSGSYLQDKLWQYVSTLT